MADDRMKNDDLQRDMRQGGGEGQDWGKGGQQSPGRNPQGGQQGQPGQQGGQYGQQGGQQKDRKNIDDEEEFGGGQGGQQGGQGRGQNR